MHACWRCRMGHLVLQETVSHARTPPALWCMPAHEQFAGLRFTRLKVSPILHFSPLRAPTHPSRLSTCMTCPGEPLIKFAVADVVKWLSYSLLGPLLWRICPPVCDMGILATPRLPHPVVTASSSRDPPLAPLMPWRSSPF